MSDLELILNNVKLGTEVPFFYVQDVNADGSYSNDHTIEVPNYLMVVKREGSNNIVKISVNDITMRAPIGFFYDTNGARFHITEDALLEPVLDTPGKFFIPLVGTEYSNVLGTWKDSTVTNAEKNQVLGISGSQGVHPLNILYLSGENRYTIQLYMNSEGKVTSSSRNFSKLNKKTVEYLNDYIDKITKPNHKDDTDTADLDWSKPKLIKQYLDQFVIDQEEAKVVVSVAFSNYMLKVKYNDPTIEKGNVLLLGSTGVGKSYMIRLLAKKAKIPFASTKITGKSVEGYKGENLSSVLEQIRMESEGLAPYGVVFVDEIDKSAVNNDDFGFGLKIQYELVGWAEDAVVNVGTDAKINSGETKAAKGSLLSTKNLLFVAAGAFESVTNNSLEKIISRRLGKGTKQIGFNSANEPTNTTDYTVLDRVMPVDLINYGFIPELVGRFPVIGVLHPLSESALVKILSTAKNSPIDTYTNLLGKKGFKTNIPTETLQIIAQACPPTTGARALQSVLNDLFTEILFDPEKYVDAQGTITVTPELAKTLINLYTIPKEKPKIAEM